jgi:hypothetical protein
VVADGSGSRGGSSSAGTVSAGVVPAASATRLPITWPLAASFVLFPLWWLLGVSAFIWLAAAIPMAGSLIRRKRVRAPIAITIWLAFISWVFLSGLQIEAGTKILTFAYRISLYITAAVIFFFVYNLPRSVRWDVRVLRILTAFWMTIVVTGIAGIVFRGATFVPPFEHLIPHGLRSRPFVQELVRPVFAQVQSFLGFPVPRPAAPFPYTNQWGANMAVLTPVAIAGAIVAGRGLRRRIIVAMLLISLVPMVVSLNRGMFLSLGLGVVYVAIRYARRGRIAALAAMFGLVCVVAAIVVFTPLGHLLNSSFSSTHGNSNTTRESLYQQAYQGANKSPLFGHGSPEPVSGQSDSPPIGTQGQLWMVLYSNGYPAAALFVLFMLCVIWQTRRVRDPAATWLQAVPLIALSQIAVYGWLPVEAQVVMAVSALAYRAAARSTPAARAPGTGNRRVEGDSEGGEGAAARPRRTPEPAPPPLPVR